MSAATVSFISLFHFPRRCFRPCHYHTAGRLLLVLALLPFSGCGVLQKVIHQRKRPAATGGLQPMLVGTIALVNEPSHFVLIDNGDSPAPSSGAILKSYGAGAETGELLATEVGRRPFIIADIKAGAPKKGDRVILPVTGVRAALPAHEEPKRKGFRLWPRGKQAPQPDGGSASAPSR